MSVVLSAGARATLAAQGQGSAPPFEAIGAVAARAAFDAGWAALQQPPEDVPAPVLADLGGCPALIWRDAAAPPVGARVILYLHGGGWVVGSPQSHAAICRRLARACAAVVICPDYRLAPEHPFPAAAEDAIRCLAALPARAQDLGISAQRIVVAGDSAGGNLAAVAALAAARDPNLPQPRAQLLFYPNTDARQSSASYARFAEGFGLTATTMRWFRDQYLPPAPADTGGKNPDLLDWRVSPLLASVAGAAPAFVALAGADILFDEGAAYADHLTRDGVAVETRIWPGQLHGFLSACRYEPAATEAIGLAANMLDRLAV